MAQQPRHFMDEPDIGSGEKTPAQKDLEREQRSVHPSKGDQPNGSQRGQNGHAEGRVLQDGTHLARILARALPDGTYEAQVYVRLTREPEIAETYIPAGTFATESEAWSAAEERAQRAFKEHEF